MQQVSIEAALKRINRKLNRDNSRICTSTPRERPNVGRWHIVDDRNTVGNWWQTIKELEEYARDLGALHSAECIVE